MKNNSLNSRNKTSTYLNSLPQQQRVSTWSTGTLWSIAIIFAVILLTLIIGAVVFIFKP